MDWHPFLNGLQFYDDCFINHNAHSECFVQNMALVNHG